MTTPVGTRTAPAAGAAPSPRVLQRGATGDDVTALQRLLVEKGYLTAAPTGTFDAATDRAAKAFQQAARLLPADGKVGPKTLAALRQAPTPATTGAGFVAGAGRPPPRRPSFLPTPSLLPAPVTEHAVEDLPKSVAGVPVQRAVELEYSNATSQLDGANGVELHFGALSRPQFDALKAEFGGRTAIAYDPARGYVASDFLPPALQALVNQDYDSGPSVALDKPQAIHRALQNENAQSLRVNSTPNCHGTAWEAMRAMQGQAQTHVELLFADGGAAMGQYGYQLDTVAQGSTDSAGELLAQLKPGDVVMFTESEDAEEATHSAVYVGGGLFFEKQDTEYDDGGSEYPYRLGSFERVAAPLVEQLGGPLQLSAFRPKGPLATGTSTYGTSPEAAAAVERWAAQRGKSVGRLFTTELDRGMSGRVLSSGLNAAAVLPLETGPDGRARVKPAP